MDFKWVVAITTLTIAAIVFNHIDDTDETYGYWEPLHYVLYGKGMQTWEYDPVFAIRSYAFIFPLKLFGTFLQRCGIEKIQLFYCLRALIGLFSAFGQYRLLQAVNDKYNSSNVTAKRLMVNVVALFLLLSPGIFFASTSFLPSAISMTLTMLSLAAWLKDKLPESIFWGSLAVLGTGWPFVGLIFLPLGVHMLVSSFSYGGFYQIVRLCIIGIVIVLCILLPVTSIDFIHYQQPTIPFWNILTYNTGNQGDELYGIEPMSYYVKNLLLTTGFAFPLACLAPILEIFQWLLTMLLKNSALPANLPDSEILTVYVCLALWLGVLFSRPHKEERFLYPAYPLLVLAAARSVLNLLHLFRAFVVVVVPSTKPSSSSATSTSFKNLIMRYGQAVLYTILAVCVVTVFSLRVLANVRNYFGYMAVWRDLHAQIVTDTDFTALLSSSPSSSSDSFHQSDSPQHLRSEADRIYQRIFSNSIRVCTGSEWHLFPTHFFLPAAASLFYIEDGFRGILPQHYAPSADGTFRTPLLPNNDENLEEVSRYINVDDCDYIVTSKDVQSYANRLHSRHEMEENDEIDKKDRTETHLKEDFPSYLEVLSSRPVLDRDATTSPALRALYLPTLPDDRRLVFKAYRIIKVKRSPATKRKKTFSFLPKEEKTTKAKQATEKRTKKNEGVGATLMSSLLKGLKGTPFVGQNLHNLEVKNEMTKEELAKRLGLDKRRKGKKQEEKKTESGFKVESSGTSASDAQEVENVIEL